MLITQKSLLLPRKLALGTFGELLIVFSTFSLFNGPGVMSSASNKAELFAKNFSRNSNLNDSGIFLPAFPSRTNPKLHISVTNTDLSKAPGPNCISAVVLKNCEPELL